jgi:hypothetical protein
MPCVAPEFQLLAAPAVSPPTRQRSNARQIAARGSPQISLVINRSSHGGSSAARNPHELLLCFALPLHASPLESSASPAA